MDLTFETRPGRPTGLRFVFARACTRRPAVPCGRILDRLAAD